MHFLSSLSRRYIQQGFHSTKLITWNECIRKHYKNSIFRKFKSIKFKDVKSNKSRPWINSFCFGILIYWISLLQRLLNPLESIFGNCRYRTPYIEDSTTTQRHRHKSKCSIRINTFKRFTIISNIAGYTWITKSISIK